jgi:hypothetical protein
MEFSLRCQNANGEGRTTTISPTHGWMLVAVSLISIYFISLRNGVFDYHVSSRIDLRPAQMVRMSSKDHICVTNLERGCHEYSNSSYQWIGDSWIPPPGIPRYTPEEMQQLLQLENVLMVGDSTARQDYFTMFNLMNATDPHDISYEELDHGINVNKNRLTEKCTLRDDKLTSILSVCRQVPGLKQESDGSANQNVLSTFKTVGAFDMTPNPGTCDCFSDVSDFVQKFSSTLSSFYSVLVFSIGIWDSVQPDVCTKSGEKALLRTLDYLKVFSDDTGTSIIWKTHGGSKKENKTQRRFTKSIHLQTRRWFRMNQPVHMALADFGSQVAPRTYDQNRIKGDSPDHFGADARTLSLQMITDAIMEQRWNNPNRGGD